MSLNKLLTASVAGIVGLSACTGVATAGSSDQTLDKRFYIAPMISYGFFDQDKVVKGPGANATLERDNSVGGTLAVGKPINKWLNLEVYGFYFNPDETIKTSNGYQESVGHGSVWGLGLDAMLFPARQSLPVYGLLGAAVGQHGVNGRTINKGGGVDSSSSDMAFTRYFDAGVGYVYPITPYGLKIRAEYRYRYTGVDTNGDVTVAGRDQGGDNAHFGDHILSLGFEIPLGKPSSNDTDKPGPAPTPEPRDDDNDNVINANDACPDTPANTKVDSEGCKIESQVQEQAIELRGVTFRFDKSVLTNQAQRRLRSVTSALQAAPSVDFRLDGYTDNIGNADYNKKLSQKRVDSVKDYLTSHQISAERITKSKGHGESNPVASNKTKAGRDKNRRVEMTVTHTTDQ